MPSAHIESGSLTVIVDEDGAVGGQPAVVRRGANGALILPIVTRQPATEWTIRLASIQGED